MKFEITRTSFVEGQPCSEAKEELLIYVDTRNALDVSEVPSLEKNPNAWYGYGANHRVENGKITRDIEHLAWTIEIESLEELVSLAKAESRIIISQSSCKECDAYIEIYDNYRE